MKSCNSRVNGAAFRPRKIEFPLPKRSPLSFTQSSFRNFPYFSACFFSTYLELFVHGRKRNPSNVTGKISIALIIERGWWRTLTMSIAVACVLFYQVSRVQGRETRRNTRPQGGQKERRQTSDDQINYSDGTTMARAASLLALIKLPPLPCALLPLAIQSITTYG